MELLPIYLEDHLALSLGGIRLARRCQRANRDRELGKFLARLVPELEADRAVLADVARVLGGGPSPLKDLLARVAELVGRFKMNGKILRYSELSRVWELEGLAAGTESRRALWKLLAKLQERDPRLAGFDFTGREERAHGHRDELQRHRLRAAEEAFRADLPRARRAAAAPAR